jgi:putative cell wall-binding protein/3',5'-cyclic AMP phosphodiesterase CpdA/chitodextrinase
MSKKFRKVFSVFFVFYFAFLQVALAAPIPEVKSSSNRLAGDDRYKTAIEVSKNGWDKSEYAVVVRGDDFADALCAAPLAKKYNAPILLTQTKEINSDALNEVKRLQVKHAFVVGGDKAISQKVEKDLKAQVADVTRISGNDRYETSVEIAKRLDLNGKIAVATGSDFADALSISSIAAKLGMPILLTEKNKLPNEVKKYISDKSIDKTYVIGGTSVISNTVLNSLPKASRISGNNRFETNLAIMKEFENEISFGTIYLAVGYGPTGKEFADALSGAALAAQKGAPIVIVYNTVDTKVLDYLKSKVSSSIKVIALGGVKAVPESVLNTVTKLVDDNTPIDPGQPGGDDKSYAMWVPTNCEKILKDQDAPKDANTKLNIEAAKNEYEGGQVILKAVDKELTNVSANVTDLTFGDSKIPADQISIYRQHYIHVTEPTTDLNPGWYPDALIPLTGSNSTFTVEKGKNQGIWITVHVPKGTTAGVYEGKLNIKGNGIDESIPIKMTVRDFELTDESHSKTAFATWWGHIPYGHPNAPKGSKEYMDLIKNYYSFFLDYRISSTYLPVDDSDVDKFVEEAEPYIKDPRVTAYSIPYYSDATKTAGLVKKLKEKDLLDKGYFYIIDEPGPDQFAHINDVGKTIKGFDKDVKHLVTMDINDAVKGSVNLWCSILTSWVGEYPQLAREYQNQGDSVWWYTCVNPKKPFPSYHIDDYLTGARMLSWMQKSYNVEGNLYWATNIYQKYDLEKGYIPRDIWNDPKAFPGANGDGYLVYPGTDYGINGPIGTIRLEAIRDGNEDYEYLWTLEKEMKEAANSLGIEYNTEEAMKTYFDRLFKSVKSYNNDPENLLEVRREVAQDIVNLNKDPKYLVKIGESSADETKITIYAEKGSSIKVNGDVINDVTNEGNSVKAEVAVKSNIGLNEVCIAVEKDGKVNTSVKKYVVTQPETKTYPVKISYFEKPEDVEKWKLDNTITSISDRLASQGINSMQVTYKPGVDWPNIRLSQDNGGLAITDWSDYETFDFDVYNEEEGFTAQIYVKFFDKDGKSFDRNWFNIPSKRKSHISIPIKEIGLDVSKMGMIEVWLPRSSQPVTLHFDNFVLTKKKDISNTEIPTWSKDSKLEANNITTSGVSLSWNKANENVENYEIYMNGKLLDSIPSTSLGYEVKGLNHNTNYTFKVEVRDKYGNISEDGPTHDVKTEDDQVIISFPVISDIHLDNNEDSESAKKFSNALNDLNEINPKYDAMVIVGDMTDNGLDDQYDNIHSVLDKNAHGTVYYTIGDHEYWKARLNGNNELSDDTFPNGETEEMTHDRFMEKTGMPGVYYDKWVGPEDNQYHFIFLSPDKFWQTDKSIGDRAYISDEQIQWLEEKLAEKANENKPIFVFTHQPLPDTVPGSNSSNSIIQYNKVKKVLAKYPQVVMFSGHTHYNLNMPNNMVQEYFTMFDTSSVLGYKDEYSETDISQGLYVEVYKDKVVVKGREFSNKEWIDGEEYRLYYPMNLPKMDIEAPTWPEGSKVETKDIGSKKLTLEWTKAADNTGVKTYRIFKDGIPVLNVSGDTNSATIKDLKPETEYEFSVEALDKDGNVSENKLTLKVKTSEYIDQGEPKITLSTNEVKLGDKIEVTLANIPEEFLSNYSWVGLYEENKTPGQDGGALWWGYTSDLIGGQEGGTFTFDASSPNVAEGKTYRLILFQDGNYIISAEATFKVTE